MADLSKAASELESIARHLREAGETGLRDGLQKAIRDAVRPVGDEVRAQLPDYMPGRYAAVLGADLKTSTYTRLEGGNPRASLTGRSGGGRRRALRRLEGGTLGHPVYGMRSRANPRRWAAWVYQEDGVKAGFFSGPAERAAPQVREAIMRALADVAAKAARKGL